MGTFLFMLHDFRDAHSDMKPTLLDAVRLTMTNECLRAALVLL